MNDKPAKFPLKQTKHEGISSKLYQYASPLIITSKLSNKCSDPYIQNPIFTKINQLYEIVKKLNASDSPLNYYNEYRRKLMDIYLNETMNSKKENLEKIKKIIMSFSNDPDEQWKLKEISCSIYGGMDHSLKMLLEKYRNEILYNINYKALNEKENHFFKKQLKQAISGKFTESLTDENKICPIPENPPEAIISSNKPSHFNLIDLDEEPQRKPLQSSDNKCVKGSLKKVSENIGFELIDLQNHRKCTTIPIQYIDEKQNENYMMKMLIEDFKNTLRLEVSDLQCTNYLKRANKNVIEAIELFFQAKYNSPKLKVIYLFPDGKEYIAEFAFTANPDDLFVPVYANYPSANEIDIFYKSRRLEINPVLHKFIGDLGLLNNSKLYVVCK
jgi:hypothetical protein